MWSTGRSRSGSRRSRPTPSPQRTGRSPDEVRFLMGFNRDVIRRRRDEMHDLGVRVRWAGRTPRLWKSVIRELGNAEELTQDNDVLTLTMCVNYGGRAELADAAKSIAREVAAGRLHPTRSTSGRLPGISTCLRFRTPIWSGVRRASSACRTSCSGRRRTANSCSAMCCGPTWIAETFGLRWKPTRPGLGDTVPPSLLCLVFYASVCISTQHPGGTRDPQVDPTNGQQVVRYQQRWGYRYPGPLWLIGLLVVPILFEPAPTVVERGNLEKTLTDNSLVVLDEAGLGDPRGVLRPRRHARGALRE